MFLPNSFKQNSFLPVSFRFPESPTQDGRSGYWRLFYTKLQEEALKKDDKEAKTKPAEPPTPAVVAPKRIKRRAAKVQRAEPHAPEARIIPFVLRPVVEQQNTYDALAQLNALPMATVFSLSVYQKQVIISNTNSRKRARRRAAAFLLLAA